MNEKILTAIVVLMTDAKERLANHTIKQSDWVELDVLEKLMEQYPNETDAAIDIMMGVSH